jgi:hypothetical protein
VEKIFFSERRVWAGIGGLTEIIEGPVMFSYWLSGYIEINV